MSAHKAVALSLRWAHPPSARTHHTHGCTQAVMRDVLGNACALLRQVGLVLVKITSKRLVHAATTLALRHGTAHTVERCCTAAGRLGCAQCVHAAGLGGPRRMTVLNGARFHQSRAGHCVRSTVRRALHTAPVVTTARLASGDAPHLRRDWRTSAPGLAHICAGTGAHLRRDSAAHARQGQCCFAPPASTGSPSEYPQSPCMPRQCAHITSLSGPVPSRRSTH